MEESRLKDTSTEKLSLTEAFYKMFPFYLYIGMTYEQYWNEDVCLTNYYREAYEMKCEHLNQEKWLQGMYIYDAISTSLYNMFGRRKGRTPRNYAEKPYDIYKKEDKTKQEELERERSKVWLINFVNAYQNDEGDL